MDCPLPTLLLVGNAGHAEMRTVADTVATLVPSKQLFRAVAISDIEQVLAPHHAFPDLVIVCQTWPDDFTRGEISRLFEMFPLAAVLCCFGSWCDSDGRSRDLWPPATRVSASASAGLIRRIWDGAATGRPPLPKTAAIEEVFARQHAGTIGHLGRNKNRQRPCLLSRPCNSIVDQRRFRSCRFSNRRRCGCAVARRNLGCTGVGRPRGEPAAKLP